MSFRTVKQDEARLPPSMLLCSSKSVFRQHLKFAHDISCLLLSERVAWIAATVQVSMAAAYYHCLACTRELNGQISVAKPGTAAAICSLSLLPSVSLSV